MKYKINVYEDDNWIDWLKNNQFHRLYGPACEYTNGDRVWWKNGRQHRLDGPAVEEPSGYKVWHIDGYLYTKEEFNRAKNEI